MRIFAWEYVTSGGWRECEGSRALIAEGAAMLRALVRDLSNLPNVEPVVARDPGIEIGELQARHETIDRENLWESWRRIAAGADAVWPIAPETDGLLERATALAEGAGRPVLNSRPGALATARSKRATARQLGEHGIPVVPCMRFGAAPPGSTHGWIVKPDDGAGATDTYFMADQRSLERWRPPHAGQNFIVQPFVPGIPISLSMLAQDGAAWLLACNTQDITCADGAFAYHGGTVGGAEARRADLEPLAARIAAALPDLWGYVGVDLVDGAAGPVVLEINPRLTTSYVGLGESLGLNPASLVLALRERKLQTLVGPLAPRPVEIRVGEAS